MMPDGTICRFYAELLRISRATDHLQSASNKNNRTWLQSCKYPLQLSLTATCSQVVDLKIRSSSEIKFSIIQQEFGAHSYNQVEFVFRKWNALGWGPSEIVSTQIQHDSAQIRHRFDTTWTGCGIDTDSNRSSRTPTLRLAMHQLIKKMITEVIGYLICCCYSVVQLPLASRVTVPHPL